MLSQAKAKARNELGRRRSSASNLLAFTQYTFPNYRVGAHHQRLAEALEAVERGEITRLMVDMPPRHGKSELVSKRFPAWYIGKNPDKQIISASYGAKLAAGFGRHVRNIVGSTEFGRIFPDVSLAPDSKAKDEWNTNHGGVYVAVGVDGASTGRGAHILNIDDPFKDRQDADSEVVREHVWDWYTSTAYTRLMPGSAIILTMTRWHQDDLAGRLLQEAANGADQWHRVSMPAINDAGEALWPDAYPIERLREIERAIGPRDWSALYQQDPKSLEGSLFKTTAIDILPAAPAGRNIVRAWDLAATKQTGTRDPDWTAGVKLLRTDDGRFVILDVVRLRGGPDEVEAAIVNTAKQDGASVRVSIPQDPGQAGKTQVLYLTRKLSGFRVESSVETGDKSTRAAPVASQVNVGNFAMVSASWNRAMLDEIGGFPSASHDDTVDALSRAFSMVGMGARPIIFSPELLRRI